MVAPLRPDSKDLNTVVTLSISFSVNISGWLILHKIIKKTIDTLMFYKRFNINILWFWHMTEFWTKRKEKVRLHLHINSPFGNSIKWEIFSIKMDVSPVIADPNISVYWLLLHTCLEFLLHVSGHCDQVSSVSGCQGSVRLWTGVGGD